MAIINANDYVHISTQTTTQVYTGTCVFKRITINTAAAGIITIYDEIGSGTTHVVAIIAATAVGSYEYNVPITRGLKVVTAAASDVTVCFSV